MKNTLIVALTRLVVATLCPLPRPLLRSLGRALGAVAYACLPFARATAFANLALAFPRATRRERARMARRAYLTLGALLGDTLARLSSRAVYPGAIPFDSDTSRRALAEATASGRGVMLLSAHLGPYEDVARSLLAHGAPLLAVTKAAYDPRLEFVFERLRRGLPSVARDQPGAAMRMVRHLRGGGVLGIPMDLASRVPSVRVPFFGQLAATPVGPARIALRTSARVVVCTAVRAARVDHGRAGADRYALKVTEIRTDDLVEALADPAAREVALCERINRELCERILSLPEAWPWMHGRFGEAPPSVTSAASPAGVASPASVTAKPERSRLSGLATGETR